MKLIFKLLFVVFLSCSLTFCKKKEEIKSISMDIGGMTCEIGCAKLIESRLVKLEGVQKATVVFNDSIGEVTFDANTISKDEIVNTIENIADGELYSVKKVAETE